MTLGNKITMPILDIVSVNHGDKTRWKGAREMPSKDQITASEAMIAAKSATRDDTIFRYSVEDFLSRWGPDDPREFAEFSADLMNLQRRMWLDAATPDGKMLRSVMDNLVKISPLNRLVPTPPED